MALSNWDTLAFDEDAKPTNGVINGFEEGTCCEIYKNWLYVRDEKMWAGGRGYIEPTIAQVNSGSLAISDFNIEATRGPQDAIFVVVTSKRYNDRKEGENYQPPEIRRMAGIGCYGYSEPPYERVRKEHGLEEEWRGFGHGGGEGKVTFVFFNDVTKEMKEVKFEGDPEEYECQWIGVAPETLAKFIKWLKSDEEYTSKYGDKEYKEWIDKIEKAEAMRFNQGDMFFAHNAGIELSVTPVGQQSRPVMEDICEAMKKQDSEKQEDEPGEVSEE